MKWILFATIIAANAFVADLETRIGGYGPGYHYTTPIKLKDSAPMAAAVEILPDVERFLTDEEKASEVATLSTWVLEDAPEVLP